MLKILFTKYKIVYTLSEIFPAFYFDSAELGNTVLPVLRSPTSSIC